MGEPVSHSCVSAFFTLSNSPLPSCAHVDLPVRISRKSGHFLPKGWPDGYLSLRSYMSVHTHRQLEERCRTSRPCCTSPGPGQPVSALALPSPLRPLGVRCWILRQRTNSRDKFPQKHLREGENSGMALICQHQPLLVRSLDGGEVILGRFGWRLKIGIPLKKN
jgi:hypothetical protein